MITSLTIKNYALIDELTICFTSGLDIITGETGAGKSIIIDAVGLILGARATNDVVRAGTDKAVVEGVFDISGNEKLRKLLTDNDLDFTDELIVRREISAKGTNRCLVNDAAVTLGLLKTIGEMLVDLHGQHEHQSLLRPETHIDMLDEFGGLQPLVAEFSQSYTALQKLSRTLADLRDHESQLKEKLALYSFQLQEIDAVNPRPAEEEEIETELRILENAEHLVRTTSMLYELLYEREGAVHDMLGVAQKELAQLAVIDKQFAESVNECQSAAAIVDELAKSLQRYSSSVEFHPERLEELRQRLATLIALRKKYGGTIQATLAHRDRIRTELDHAGNYDATLQKLTAELDIQRKECGELGRQLSAKRQDVARRLDKEIVRELTTLGIQYARFETRFTLQHVPPNEPLAVPAGKETVRAFPNGIDEAQFFISTNLGEEPKPLSKIASGGEVSRIMLALKSILAKSDKLPVLIFDEIDTGVSGRIAQAVGLSMKNLSKFHQIIAITHLPQIAGLADSHYVVEKNEAKKRTTTTIRQLSIEERVREVAKLMSGAEVTEAGLRNARELMKGK